MTARVNNAQSVYLRRSSTWLVGGFAAVALLLGIGELPPRTTRGICRSDLCTAR